MVVSSIPTVLPAHGTLFLWSSCNADESLVFLNDLRPSKTFQTDVVSAKRFLKGNLSARSLAKQKIRSYQVNRWWVGGVIVGGSVLLVGLAACSRV